MQKTLIISCCLITSCALLPGQQSAQTSTNISVTAESADLLKAINVPESASLPTKINILNSLKLNPQQQINFTLSNESQQILDKDLQETHTQKVHIMLIDPNYTDYQHIHPQLIKSSESEYYSFRFTPKANSYIMWADVTNTNGQQTYLKTNLGNAVLNNKQVVNTQVKVGAYKVNLVDNKIKQNTMNLFIVVITKNGKPVKNLQPIMNATAHVAIFTQNGTTFIHAHPQQSAQEQTGVLSFHLEPKVAGYAKMFIQFKVNNQEYLAPFGFYIAADTAQS